MTTKPKPVQTVRQALAWIHRNLTPAQLNEMGHKTPRDALLWFAAQSQAEGLRDCNLRGLAWVLIDGLKPMTLADVREEWAENQRQWEADNAADPTMSAERGPFDMTDELEDFFTDRRNVAEDDEEEDE